MQIKTFSKLIGALAYLFGKVKASEDSGFVVVSAFWLGRYWVLAETHTTKPDAMPSDLDIHLRALKYLYSNR